MTVMWQFAEGVVRMPTVASAPAATGDDSPVMVSVATAPDAGAGAGVGEG